MEENNMQDAEMMRVITSANGVNFAVKTGPFFSVTQTCIQ
jgi:hypothetical protein